MDAPLGLSRMLATPFIASLLERGYGVRNRLLASLPFQRFAASLPLTRPVAQKRAREVFDLCAGFVYSQILQSCVQLKLFDALQDGPKTLRFLSENMSLSNEAARTLLDAAVALKLVDRLSLDRYGLGSRGAVIAGNPGIVKMIEHHQMLYADLADPVALLRGERGDATLATYWAYASSDVPHDLADQRIAAYTDLMSASQTLIAEEILHAYPIAHHRRLLDVGGGDGTFLRAAAAHAPNLELALFDLPAVAERARSRFAMAELSGRATAIGGDFFRDELPSGFDLISLVRIIHDHDDGPVRSLLRTIHKALPPGGRLLIAEPLSETGSAGPVGDAYFGFYLLAMGSGRPRTAGALIQMLQGTGFQTVRQIKTRMPLQTGLLIADA